jgi:hypothetical protein
VTSKPKAPGGIVPAAWNAKAHANPVGFPEKYERLWSLRLITSRILGEVA